MTPTEQLQSLLDRVERAEGADRGLDYVIHGELVLGHKVVPRGLDTPFYTASVDAGLGLVERVLPGSYVGLQQNRWHDDPSKDRSWTAYLSPPDSHEEFESELSKTPALAICAALLRTKLSTPESQK